MKSSLSLGTTVALLALSFASVAKANPELESLRSGWKTARASALAPIDQKYRQSLIALKERLTKAGRLQDAVEVDAELQKLSGANDTKVITNTKWKWWESDTMEFLEDGRAIYRSAKGSRDMKWHMAGDKLVVDDPETGRTTGTISGRVINLDNGKDKWAAKFVEPMRE